MRQFMKRLFCGHVWLPNLKKDFVVKNGYIVRKRHFYECEKCGKRRYAD